MREPNRRNTPIAAIAFLTVRNESLAASEEKRGEDYADRYADRPGEQRRPAPDAVKQADRGQWITVGPGKREWPYKL